MLYSSLFIVIIISLFLITRGYLILVHLKYKGILLPLLQIYFLFKWVLIDYILYFCYVNEYIFVQQRDTLIFLKCVCLCVCRVDICTQRP